MKYFLVLISLFWLSHLCSQPAIGLALSGGGARGLAHIGVLKVIDEMNIPIDYIAGTSSGGIIGALYAVGFSALEIENIFLKLEWDDIFNETISRRDQYIGNKRWKPYANYFFDVNGNMLPKLPQAFLSGNKLLDFLFQTTYHYSHIRNFEELPIPFRCVATNILNGEQEVFSQGVLHEALRATMSFPSILQPFEIDGELYIDGGVVSNLPVEIVQDMGADIIIGIKASSGLKSEENLRNLIDVLDQTVNLSITENVQNSMQLCDILIEPELQTMSVLDFRRKKEIIALGEVAARKYFQENPFYINRERLISETDKLPEVLEFSNIRVRGNVYLSKAKIREFSGLSTSRKYSVQEIGKAMRNAYNSNLFSYIYPVIEKIDDQYILIIKVKEKNRMNYGLDVSYNEQKEINLGITLKLDNVVQKNSKMLVNLQLGDRQEFNLDYVKNFGKHWGVYFHLFPYIKEFTLYSYNNEHEKTNSVRSLEYGGTFGAGLFIRKGLILEGYGYSYHSRLYRNIAEFDEREVTSSGLGIKLLHENLDDYLFPMQGTELFVKYSQTRKDVFSDFSFRSFFNRLRFILPVTNDFSMIYKFEYGSHFESKDNDYDPFYIGGLDSFMGLYPNEKIAPIYKINSLSLRSNWKENIFLDLRFNLLNLGNVDYWQPEKFIYRAAGLVLGYRSLLGPIRLGVAVDEDYHSYYYFSFGYEFDQFEFSRR